MVITLAMKTAEKTVKKKCMHIYDITQLLRFLFKNSYSIREIRLTSVM